MKEISFKSWLETSLRDIIKPVPQSSTHHAEGDVWIHTRMVRKQLTAAVLHFQELTADKNSAFSNFDPNLTQEEMNILKIGAWMHDIGKASATTIGDKSWKDGGSGAIKAIGHEDPQHFEPMMKQLGEPWQSMYQKASPQDKEDLWFIIQYHMSLKDRFGRSTLKQLMDETGKFKNDRRTKLLLILILMDQSGRIQAGQPKNINVLPGISDRMNQSAIEYQAKIAKSVNNPAPDDPKTFLDILQGKNLTPQQIRQAYKGKFGKDLEVT
jgi:hypothetical protein